MLRDRLQGRGTDPLLHHAGRRAVLVAGAGAAGGPAAGGPGGLSRRAGRWHRGAGRPCCWRPDGPGRRNTDGAGGAQPMRRLAGRMLRDSELLCTAMLVAGLNLTGLLVLCCRPLRGGAAAVAGFGWIGMAVALAGTLGALGTGACRPRKPRAAGGAGPALRGGRRGGAGIGNLLAPMPGVWWAVAALPIFAGYGLAIPTCWDRRCDATATAWAGPARSAWATTACWGCCWRRRRGCLSARPCRWRWPGRGVALAWRACIGCAAGCPEFPPRRHARRRVLRRVPPPHWRAPSARADGAQHVDDGVLAALAGMPQGLRPSLSATSGLVPKDSSSSTVAWYFGPPSPRMMASSSAVQPSLLT